MANERKSARKVEADDTDATKFFTATWVKFVNVELTKADKEDWAVWTMEVNLYDALDAQTSLGRVVTVKMDIKQKCGICTILERDSRSPNAGKMVSARGSTGGIALSRALFIVMEVLGNAKWENLDYVSEADKW